MADIRINALATTAASTASDDYIAIDGSANGTRKLSAYSPTFGGNLTVSGTGNNQIGGSGSKIGLGTAPNASAGTYIKNSSGYTLLVDTGRTDAGTTGIFLRDNAGSVRGWVGFDPTGTTLQISGNGGGTAIGDNLTVSGASYNNFTGALWLGTTAGYGTLNVGNVSGTGTATYSCLTIGDQNTPANATGLYMRGTSAVCGISTAGAPIAFFTGGPGTSEAARFFNNGNFGIGTGSTDGGQKLQVNGTAAFSGTVTTTNSFTTSTRTPGNDTAIQTLRADAANTDWPFQLSSIYDGGYVDNFAIFGGILGTGTRSAPKFTSSNATGAWILRSFEGGAYFYVSRVAGASTNASPTDILSFNSTGNATFAGTVIANKATTAFRIPTAETPASASATGTIGTITWDTSYIYVCTAANTWKRVAIATW